MTIITTDSDTNSSQILRMTNATGTNDSTKENAEMAAESEKAVSELPLWAIVNDKEETPSKSIELPLTSNRKDDAEAIDVESSSSSSAAAVVKIMTNREEEERPVKTTDEYSSESNDKSSTPTSASAAEHDQLETRDEPNNDKTSEKEAKTVKSKLKPINKTSSRTKSSNNNASSKKPLKKENPNSSHGSSTLADTVTSTSTKSKTREKKGMREWNRYFCHIKDKDRLLMETAYQKQTYLSPTRSKSKAMLSRTKSAVIKRDNERTTDDTDATALSSTRPDKQQTTSSSNSSTTKLSQSVLLKKRRINSTTANGRHGASVSGHEKSSTSILMRPLSHSNLTTTKQNDNSTTQQEGGKKIVFKVRKPTKERIVHAPDYELHMMNNRMSNDSLKLSPNYKYLLRSMKSNISQYNRIREYQARIDNEYEDNFRMSAFLYHMSTERDRPNIGRGKEENALTRFL